MGMLGGAVAAVAAELPGAAVVVGNAGAADTGLFKLTPGNEFGSDVGTAATGVAPGLVDGVGTLAGGSAGSAGVDGGVAGKAGAIGGCGDVFCGAARVIAGGAVLVGSATLTAFVGGVIAGAAGVEGVANDEFDGGSCTWGAVSQWPASDGGTDGRTV